MSTYDIIIKGGTVIDGLRTPRYRAVRAIGHDAVPVGDNPAVTNRRFRDRQNPGGVVSNHSWRSCLPDRLRAG